MLVPWAPFTCSSWRCHKEWPPCPRSTRCSTIDSHLHRSDTVFLWSSPADSERDQHFFSIHTFCNIFYGGVLWFFFFLWWGWVCSIKVVKPDVKGRGFANCTATGRGTRCTLSYLAFETKTAFKQWVLHDDVSRPASQTTIWNNKAVL